MHHYIQADFFGPDTPGIVQELPVSPRVLKHMRAARLAVGERFSLGNGLGGGALYELLHALPDAAAAQPQITARYVSALTQIRSVQLTLVQGLAASDRMDLIVRQATELGLARIVPLASARSTVRLTAAQAGKKVERWQRIACAAAEQSGQLALPDISPVAQLTEALATTADAHVRICCWEESASGTIGAALAACPPPTRADNAHAAQQGTDNALPTGGAPNPGNAPHTGGVFHTEGAPKIALFIGPEGGFAEEEIVLLKGAGTKIVTLGPTILRTETAAVVASALVLHELGALGSR